MSNIEKVDPTIKDGVEFYVSHDGKRCGLSQRGLARLCGVSLSTLQARLDNADRQEVLKNPESCSTGGNEVTYKSPYFEELRGTNGAKIITSLFVMEK